MCIIELAQLSTSHTEEVDKLKEDFQKQQNEVHLEHQAEVRHVVHENI